MARRTSIIKIDAKAACGVMILVERALHAIDVLEGDSAASATRRLEEAMMILESETGEDFESIENDPDVLNTMERILSR